MLTVILSDYAMITRDPDSVFSQPATGGRDEISAGFGTIQNLCPLMVSTPKCRVAEIYDYSASLDGQICQLLMYDK